MGKMMEVWDILDSNGKDTGKTMIKGEPIPNGFYHLGADIWIINSENKIFIQKRSPKKRLSPNVWAMTGGSVIKGENSRETIERETMEELGIKLNTNDAQLLKKFKTGTVWIDTYFIKQDIDLQKIKMHEEKVCDVKWANYKEVEQIFKEGNFIENRWEFVRDIIKDIINNKIKI